MTNIQSISNIQNQIANLHKIPRLEADILLSHVINKSREFVLTHPEFELTKKQLTTYNLQLTKRKCGWPIAYLTGHKEFYGLDFFVNQNVLIPRPETEMMIDHVTRNMENITHDAKRFLFIDVGTGSGCVIISLAKLLNQESGIMNREFIGIDISSKALAVAHKNVKRHNLEDKIKFLKSNLLEIFIKNNNWKLKIENSLKIENCKLIILANLPYLSPAQVKSSPTIQKEPRLALLAGSDGLKYYRQLFKQIQQLGDPRSAIRDIHILCEIGQWQKKKMSSLIKKELPNAQFSIKKDLSGHNRLVIISNSSLPSPPV